MAHYLADNLFHEPEPTLDLERRELDKDREALRLIESLPQYLRLAVEALPASGRSIFDEADVETLNLIRSLLKKTSEKYSMRVTERMADISLAERRAVEEARRKEIQREEQEKRFDFGDGLYVARIYQKDRNISRSVLCRIKPVREGGMFEFLDPLSGDVVGSVGRNKIHSVVKPLDDVLATFQSHDEAHQDGV